MPKEAQQRLERAKELSTLGDYPAAQAEIDSVRAHFPRNPAALKEALELMREVELKACRRNIAFCDSLLPLRKAAAAEALKGFVLEKDTQYAQLGNYVWKRLTVERNIERCYLRCGTDENGEMYLASVYYGKKPIKHTGLRLSLGGKEGLFVQTASIPYDGGLNFRFKDEGYTSEIVTYKGNAGKDAIKFIYDHAKERIKAEYTGGRPYTIWVDEASKQGVAATYALAAALSDVHNLTLELARNGKRITYLEGKLSADSAKAKVTP
ncbi:MAG: hypothetical protein LBL81_00320 [Tannerella sp.]|nr:hypothetical protein [Tannerella sp.]